MTDPVAKLSRRLNGYKTQQGYMRDDIAALKADTEKFRQATAGDMQVLRTRIDDLQFMVLLFTVHFLCFYGTIAIGLLLQFSTSIFYAVTAYGKW